MNRKIIIIGNGFDLAHGYKTDYYSFIQNLFQESLNDNNINKELFRFEAKDNTAFTNNQIKIQSLNKYIMPLNNFFREIILEFENKNWSDIEDLYFNRLLNSNELSVNKLNQEFEVIKKKLEKYLTELNFFNEPIFAYADFFSKHNSKETIILNFNYTQTVEKLYVNETSNCKIINIHGELNNNINPIIFGYAASDIQKKELLNKNENQYLINIKSYNYKRTKIETTLKDIYDLSQYNDSDLYLIGHSCSLSDRNILHQFFNLENLERIFIVYHKDFTNYRNTLINIHRIMDSEMNTNHIVNFENSLCAPQFDDEKTDLIDFNFKINKIQ